MRRKSVIPLLLIGVIILLAVAYFWITQGWAGKPVQQYIIHEGIELNKGYYTHRGKTHVKVQAVVINPSHARFEILSQTPGTDEIRDFVAFAKQHDTPIMVNGGYFDNELNPVGLFVRDGQLVNPINGQSSLSGVVVINKQGKISVPPTAHYISAPSDRQAIQAGPFLIDAGGRPGIYSDDLKRAKRTAIGVTADQRIVLMTTTPCTLHELSQLLIADPQAIGVSSFDRVLNLDGGPSSGMYLKGFEQTKASESPVPNAIAVWPIK